MSDRSDREGLFSPIPDEYVEPLRRQRVFVFVFVLSATLTSLLLTFISSNKYLTATMIFYRPTEVVRLQATDSKQAFGSPVPTAPFKIIGNTLQDVVWSDPVLRKVALELNLHVENRDYSDLPAWERLYKQTKDFAWDTVDVVSSYLRYGRYIQEDPITDAIMGLRKNTKIASSDSYVFVLQVKDKHPLRAALTVDAIGRELVAWLRQNDRLAGEEKRLQLDALVERKAAQISALRERKHQLLADNQIVSSEIETEARIGSLVELELDRVQIEGDMEENRRKIAEFTRTLEANRGGGDLNSDDVGVMRSSLLFTQIDLEGRIAKHRALTGAIERLEGRLRLLPSVQAEIDKLDTMLASADHEYVLLSDAQQEAVIRSTDSQSSTRVLHAAAVPAKPVQPIKIYHVALSFVLSLLLGVGLVYMLTYLNVRILFPSAGIVARESSESGAGPGSGE